MNKMTDITDKIEELTEQWNEYVEMKNSYQFGDEPINMNDFEALIKESFDTMCSCKKLLIQNKKLTINTYDLFTYIYFIKTVSRYIPDSCVNDESENFDFTVTWLIADALMDWISDYNYDTKRELYVDTTSYAYSSFEDFDDFIVYDIDSPNYKKIYEFAKCNPML